MAQQTALRTIFSSIRHSRLPSPKFARVPRRTYAAAALAVDSGFRLAQLWCPSSSHSGTFWPRLLSSGGCSAVDLLSGSLSLEHRESPPTISSFSSCCDIVHRG
ncbi:hypothetical protein SAICODRAFT_66840 [Saitoella complicata NRRL Y-17804]|uniref:uncharacterized protein n=1 Tax=Saitoella complicata (strain BCRC 22490 / CBS 7301 / JCM 7358 / NBRC 10748 / NRRL Y-17804) TaxID=698492 RepID=UPI0008668DAA|nr:uncharacterized protein SAICODRAFT_66840 [Saitoella complicata NRRL Y-17804]ODQ51545.1 hypothetical protein SAICODRAFT_66840 [Saitoella complicata NRRL Y-17804]